MTADYAKALLAANLRALTGTEAHNYPDTPGAVIEFVIKDEINELEELPRGTTAEAIFISYCGDFLIDARVATLHESPSDALARIRTLADDLRNDLRQVLARARDDEVALEPAGHEGPALPRATQGIGESRSP